MANVNDAPTASLSSNTVNEYAAANTVIGSLIGQDPDAGDTSFIFELLDNAGGRFKLVGSNIAVASRFLLDFEQDASHDIVVRVTDAHGASFDQTLTINLNDINPEILTGSAGSDHIVGGAGADRLNGGVGNDLLEGGSGIDRLTGGDGSDDLRGGQGDDTLDGGIGFDMLSGGTGNDIYVYDGNDTIVEDLDAGIDTVQAYASITLAANVENVTLMTNLGINATGNELDNSIKGNAGSNVLTGGSGRDTMTGGGGADRFDFNSMSDSSVSGTTRDIIVDFLHGTDKIDLSDIDALLSELGDQAFTFMGTGAFTDVGQIRLTQNGLNTQILFNTEGDSAAEMSIVLGKITATAITESDFIL